MSDQRIKIVGGRGQAERLADVLVGLCAIQLSGLPELARSLGHPPGLKQPEREVHARFNGIWCQADCATELL